MNKRRNFIFFSIVWAIGLVFSLSKGQVAGRVFPEAIGLDLVVVLVAYTYLRSGATHAGIFSFVQGLCLDIYSGGFKGLFVFLYLSAVGVISLSSRFVHLNNPRGQILIVGMAWITKEVLFFVLLFALDSGVVFESMAPWPLVVAFLGTTFSAPIVFYLLERLRLSLKGTGHKEGLLQGM